MSIGRAAVIIAIAALPLHAQAGGTNTLECPRVAHLQPDLLECALGQLVDAR